MPKPIARPKQHSGKNWAAFDPRLLPELSAEERAALFGDLGTMVADNQRRILQFRADMSN